MKSNEVHLQVGESCGSTLAYATYKHYNKNHFAIGLDEDIGDLFQENEYLHFHYFKDNYADVLLKKPPVIRQNIGVCFYNDSYDYNNQFMFLKLIKPCLADEAIIIINNSNILEIREATQDWINDTPQAFLLFDLPTPVDEYHTWWNGIQVIGYQKNQHKLKKLAEFFNTKY